MQRRHRRDAWSGGQPNVRSSRGRSSPTSLKVCRCWSLHLPHGAQVPGRHCSATALGLLTRRWSTSAGRVIREEDCGTERGLTKTIAADDGQGNLLLDEHVETAVYARTLATDVLAPDGEVLLKAGVDLGDINIRLLIDNGITSVKVRSVLTCEAASGTCAMCYGRSLATGKLVDVGEAVGIVAAQSIGEPGTQLTMRTFHTGGVAGDDITQGLPRVVELFEARQPKGKAPISESTGRVKIEDSDRLKKIIITPDDGSEPAEFSVSRTGSSGRGRRSRRVGRSSPPVRPIRTTCCGYSACVGLQEHLVDEVPVGLPAQGAPIHDKHTRSSSGRCCVG